MKRPKRRILRAAIALALLLASLPPLVLGTGNEAAFADDLGYPNAEMQCVHPPYATDGTGYWCSDYQWGTIRGNTTGASLFSPRGYVYRNCTDYVAWKLQSLGVPDSLTRGLGNGGEWYNNAANKTALLRGTTPRVGAAAVVPANTPGFGGYGHVAYVEAVHGNGTIVVSEYNYGLDGKGRTRTVNPAAAQFTQFIYFGPHMTNPPDNSAGPPGGGNPTANGKFISYQGAVYRIAGGAPLYVSARDTYFPDMAGWATATPINDGHWASLRGFPADGTYLSDVETGAVYITAGGAPMYISGADAPYLPQWTSALKVPHWDFVNYQHLRRYPADGYYLLDVQTGFVYNTAGGAAFYVAGSDAPALPQWRHATPVPHGELINRQHIRDMPADGTYISDVQTGLVYITLGGAPMYISGDDAPFLPHWMGATRVSHWEFDHWSVLRPYPADGHYLRDAQTGDVYVTAGGAPLYVSAQTAPVLPQWQFASPVPHWELQSWGSLRQLPADGTYIRGVLSGGVYQVVSGIAVRVLTSPPPPATTVDDWAIVYQLGGML